MMRFCSPSASRDRVGLLSLTVLLLVACGDAGDGEQGEESAPASRRGAEEASVSAATGSTGEVPLTIQVSAGGDRAESSGTGTCTHAQAASIYGVPAALWQIQDSDAGKIRHASLTVWRPAAGGPDQFSMALSTGSAQHVISTVKGGQLVGSGSVTMQPAGEGAHFEIVGTAVEGRSVRATLHCERFAEHVAEGG